MRYVPAACDTHVNIDFSGLYVDKRLFCESRYCVYRTIAWSPADLYMERGVVHRSEKLEHLKLCRGPPLVSVYLISKPEFSIKYVVNIHAKESR